MKKLIVSITLLATLLCAGCVSVGKDLAGFVSSLPTNTVTDASLQVTTPFWGHQLSVTGMSKAPDGTIQITNLKDNFSIPLWGTTKTFSVSGLTVQPNAPAVQVTKIPTPVAP